VRIHQPSDVVFRLDRSLLAPGTRRDHPIVMVTAV
jgi:hypothetical protein